jgi:platelet-activating factor acetylhydrolase isoform II
MASHGYIVAAINHTYSSAVTLFPDGRVVAFNVHEPQGLLQIIAEDQIFVANQLHTLAEGDPKSLFTGRLNLEQLGIFGQSLGGSAAILACYRDTHFRACASEDGAVEDQVIRDGLDRPFMFLSADDHPDLPDRFYERLSGPAHTLIIDGFRHADFTDLPLWPDMTPLVEASVIGSNDRLRAVQIINVYLVAFFDHYLKGQDEPLLGGPSADYPEVDFRSRNT